MLTAIFALNSCMDFTSGKRYKEEQIVIAGMILAGESITKENPIFIGQSVSLDNFNPIKLLALNAKVTLTEVSSEGQPITLLFNPDIDLTPKGIRQIGYYDPSGYIIKSGETYKIEVNIECHDPVWAITTVPDKFTLLANEGFSPDSTSAFPKIVYDEIEEKYPLKIQVAEAKDTYLYLEIYCLEEWDNAYIVSPFSDYIGEKLEKEEDYENSMNGSPRLNRDLSIETPDSQNVITTVFFQLEFFFYGRYEVRIHVVDDNFYNYRKLSNGYLKGGVNEGIGYFSSGAREIRYTEVIR